MKRRTSLPGLVATIWTTIAALYAAMAGLLLAMVPHPDGRPLAVIGAVLIAALVGLLVASPYRIARGPGRRRALGWLLLGLCPIGLLASHFGYGLALGQTRALVVTPALKLLLPLGEAVMDLQARWLYPQRTFGRKVVMLGQPDPTAADQVRRMDQHVERLEKILGRATRWPVHWARGPLVGQSGKAVHGLCMGSTQAEATPDSTGLDGLDRHEVAHCVMSSFVTLGSNPPAWLSEGWAQWAQMREPIDLLRDENWIDRDGGPHSLRTLSRPPWYSIHDGPAYSVGGPVCGYLLETYGAGPFVELYTTCRPESFEADCRRILGRDVDTLQREYLAYRDARLREDDPEARLFAGVRLGPGVDPARWREAVAMSRAEPLDPTSLGPFRVVVDLSNQVEKAADSPPRREGRMELVSDGRRMVYRASFPEMEVRYGLDGRTITRYERREPDGPWRRIRMPVPKNDAPFAHFLAITLGPDAALAGLIGPRDDADYGRRFYPADEAGLAGQIDGLGRGGTQVTVTRIEPLPGPDDAPKGIRITLETDAPIAERRANRALIEIDGATRPFIRSSLTTRPDGGVYRNRVNVADDFRGRFVAGLVRRSEKTDLPEILAIDSRQTIRRDFVAPPASALELGVDGTVIDETSQTDPVADLKYDRGSSPFDRSWLALVFSAIAGPLGVVLIRSQLAAVTQSAAAAGSADH